MGEERLLRIFAGVKDCLLQEAIIQEKLVTSQREEIRANCLDQPPALGPLEQANDAYDRQIQTERQPPRRSVIEDDLGIKLQGEGDDFGLSGAKGCLLNLDVKRT